MRKVYAIKVVIMGQNNFMGLEDPGIAIITGASSGLGDVFARRLSDQGFDLILTARRKNRLENLAKELREKNSTNVEIMVTDLAKMNDIKRLESKIKGIDNLDFLCSNAGVGTTDNYLSPQANPDTFIDMVILHCKAPMLHMHAALPKMIERNRGSIYNISSIASLILHGSNEPMYPATKAFLSVLTEMTQLKLNYLKSNVKVKSICPGYTRTEMTAFGQTRPAPLGEWMSAEECVDIALDSYHTKDTVVITGEIFVDEVKRWRDVARKKPGRYFYW